MTATTRPLNFRAVVACLTLFASAALTIGAARRAQPGPPPAADLARQLQAHYNTVHDFTAQFTHTYKSGALKRTITEHGDVRIRKPGRMFWNYTAPEKKEFISDGTTIWSYLKDDKIVYKTPVPTGNDVSTAILFLAGKGDLTRDFRAALPKAQPADGWQLDLEPKTPQADFTFLSLIVDRKSMSLKGLTSVDAQGNTSTFAFTQLRENVGLSDNQFAFKVPKDVEVR